MTKKKDKQAASRKGKHKEGKVSVGVYITEESRALLAYLVDMTGMTATDIIMEGVMAKAQALGVIKDGKVLPQHRAAITVILEAYRTQKKNKKEKRA